METASQEDLEPEETIYSGGFELLIKMFLYFKVSYSQIGKENLPY